MLLLMLLMLLLSCAGMSGDPCEDSCLHAAVLDIKQCMHLTIVPELCVPWLTGRQPQLRLYRTTS